jgi:transposase-like protein
VYLYRAVDKFGNTIDFYLSPTRNAKAAERFLGGALNGLKDWEKPTVINTDKAPSYAVALRLNSKRMAGARKQCADRSNIRTMSSRPIMSS